LSSKEECVLGMGLMSNDATTKDAQIESSKEECVKGMGGRENYAAMKGVQIML
jgi:hypothetical protein